jgi:hypothetical protein
MLFMKLAEIYFEFLESYEFRLIEMHINSIKYDKKDINVCIFMEEYTHSLEVLFKFKGIEYGLGALISVTDIGIAKNFRTPLAFTDNGMKAGLIKLAKLIQEYCIPALEGDEDFYKKAEKQHNEIIKLYWLKMSADAIRAQASEAFQQKEYSKAIDLYLKIEPLLTKSEHAKLGYAKRTCAGSLGPNIFGKYT